MDLLIEPNIYYKDIDERLIPDLFLDINTFGPGKLISDQEVGTHLLQDDIVVFKHDHFIFLTSGIQIHHPLPNINRLFIVDSEVYYYYNPDKSMYLDLHQVPPSKPITIDQFHLMINNSPNIS